MRYSLAALPIIAVLLICDSAIAQTPQLRARSKGDALLAQAVDRLDRYPSISARIRQRAEIYDMPMIGTGLYLQGPPGSQCMRLELKLQVDDDVMSVQQVCDGNNFWVLRHLGPQQTLGRIEVRTVVENQKGWNQKPGEGGPLGIGIGGLPRLVRSLGHSFRFADPVATKLSTFPVHELRGTWRPEALARMLPDQRAKIEAGAPADQSKLPSEAPDEVYVLLGRDDLFPYRIEYRRTEGKDAETATRVLLVMELFEVRADATIEKRLFDYQPGELPIAELTSSYIENLQKR